MTEISSLPWSLAEKAYTIISILPSALDNYIEVAEPTKTAMGLQFRNPVYCGMVKLVSHRILAPGFWVRSLIPQPCGNDFPSAVSFSFL